MHTRASNSELVKPLPESERTLNRRLRRPNRRVPYDHRNNPPQHPRIVYPPVLNINYFCHFLDILQNYNPMDDEPIWAADHVVALTPGSAITIPKIANEFAIKGNHLTLVKGNQFDGRTKTDPQKHIQEFFRICDMFKYRYTKNEAVRLMMFPLSLTREAKTWLDELNEGTIETEITQEVLNVVAGGIFLDKTPNQAYQLLKDKVLLNLEWAKNHKTKSSLKKTVSFAAEGSSNSDTDKIMARMDAMTLKMDAYNTQPNPKWHNSKAYQPPQSRNEHVNVVFTRSGKSYNPPVNPNHQPNNSKTPINFDSNDEDDEPTPQPKTQNPKLVKETPLPKPYKLKIPEAQYGKFLDMIRAVRINVPLINVLAGMPNYGKFLKELISNKHKIEQISAAFLSDESLVMIQNKVPPKLRDPGSFLIPCNFNKTFSCNALADLGASINLMPYSLYAKLSLKTLKPTKMSVRLADRSFEYPIGIAENMLVKAGKFTFPADFDILEMEEDIKVPVILGRPFLHIADTVIQVKQKQLNLGVETE
ncbi:reverse transcriptase domain-containing protein [Tanacetum coccineum]